MKKTFVLLGVFAAGVICGALVLYFIIGHGAASVYANALEAQVDTALKLRLGDQETVLRQFEANLPEDVEAVRSFGDYAFTRAALWKVRAYYEAMGTSIPESIAPALAALPPRKSKSPRHAAEQERTTRTKVGDAAPALSLRSIDGQSFDLKGRVVLLNFFATWCGPCMAEMPHLEKDIWQPLQGRGILVLGVGRGHTEAELKVFRDQKHYSFPLIADPKQEIYGKFATGFIPRCVLIGKDGRIKHQSVGFVLEDFAALAKAAGSEAVQ